MVEAAAAPDPALPEPEETGPLRRCIFSGERLPKETMLRFAVDPEGSLVPDIASALPGRGLWLAADRGIIERAVKKRSFERAARRKVTVPAALADLVERLLMIRCRETIGLARRAGHAVAGYEKVREALGAGRGGLVIQAADGAADGIRKIAALAPELPVLAVLSAAELGEAFGRDHVVHAVLGPGPLAARLRIDGSRLAGLRNCTAA